MERVHREITESTAGRHVSMSRSSSTHSDNWDVVSRAVSSTLVPTLNTLASAEQIQTTAQQTRSVSFERHLAGISAEIDVSANSEAVLWFKEWPRLYPTWKRLGMISRRNGWHFCCWLKHELDKFLYCWDLIEMHTRICGFKLLVSRGILALAQ